MVLEEEDRKQNAIKLFKHLYQCKKNELLILKAEARIEKKTNESSISFLELELDAIEISIQVLENSIKNPISSTDNLKIVFEIDKYPNALKSEQNSLILFMQSILNYINLRNKTEIDLLNTNKQIERAIEILKGLKYDIV